MSRRGIRFAVVAVLILLLLISLGFAQEADHEVNIEDEPSATDTASQETGPSDVLVLTNDTIAEVIQQHPLVLIEFYAPWCPHCKALEPEWEKVATELKKNERPILVAKLDCATHTLAAEKYQIEGYPTIKLFRDGQMAHEYQGPRVADSIVRFAERQLLPASFALKTPDESHVFVEEMGMDVVVIGFFDKAEPGTPEFDEFFKTAQSLRNDGFLFGHAVNQTIRDKFLIRSVPALILFKDDDKPELFYPSDSERFESSTLVTWLKRNRMPLLDEIGPQNFKHYLQSGLPMGVLFLNYSLDAEMQSAKNVVHTVAQNFRGKVLFVYADGRHFERQARHLGLSGKKFPSFTIDMLKDNVHYAFPEDQELSVANLDSWLTKFVAGQLSRTIRSQPIPEANNDPLKVIVALTYQQQVLDESKDAFIEFYAPWCGYCKMIAPIWEQLAQRLQSIPTVLIGKMDVTENDAPAELHIRGFPTLIFFPAKNKTNPIVFDEDRTLENFLSFVQRHASYPFEIPEDTTKANPDAEEAAPQQQDPTDSQQAPPTEHAKKQQDQAQHDEL